MADDAWNARVCSLHDIASGLAPKRCGLSRWSRGERTGLTYSRTGPRMSKTEIGKTPAEETALKRARFGAVRVASRVRDPGLSGLSARKYRHFLHVGKLRRRDLPFENSP